MPAKKKTDPTEAESINGVLVSVQPDSSLSIQILGEVKATEASTLLRIAANDVDRQLGV